MAHWQAYLELCKPRVVLLMLLTSAVGMCLASPHFPSLELFFLALLGIGLVAAAGAGFNHVADRHIDNKMRRTEARPLPSGQLSAKQACFFSTALMLVGESILIFKVNLLTGLLTLAAFVGYAFIYTLCLKRLTPQNIVIGGLSGALPPLLGWTAITNHIDPQGLLLVLIIYVWTPPHFWALAIHRYKEYEKANIPMLPVTHGIPLTKWHILLYTILLWGVTYLPYAIDMSGLFYFISVTLLNSIFLYWAIHLLRFPKPETAIKTFRYSITYLGLLFAALLIDHYS